ncbi:MAG: metallophosphoesterase [Armatimonadetes bacterium]|nr:metallophosphoesterase [Armatimonadota bacterium]
MKRNLTLLLSILLILAGLVIPACATDVPALIELDAAALSDGPLSSWKSKGTLGGSFDVVPIGGAVVEKIDGRNAVTFDGLKHRFVSSFTAPASITGSSAYTIAIWALNPKIEPEEALICWAPRSIGDGKSAQINYGSSENFGAVTHWGKNDMGFDGGLPKPGEWHLIAVTYGDGVENVYVDGKLNSTEKKTNDIAPGAPIYLGSAASEKLFSGAIESVQMYDYALNVDEISFLAGSGSTKPKTALVDLSAKELPAGALSTWKNNGTLGGSFGQLKYAPLVETVDGRKSVSFSNDGWLQSASGVPNGSFTIEIWERTVQDGAQGGALTSALSLGGISAEEILRLGLSREMKAGALTSGRITAGFKTPPALKFWHQIAYAYSKDGTLRIYVDGELDSEQKCGLSIPANAPINLGAAWQKGRGIPYAGFDGAISRLCIYDCALSQLEIRTHNGQLGAFNPSPAAGSDLDTLQTTLSWEIGNLAATNSCDVYFGTDADEVAGADSSSELRNCRVPAFPSPKIGPIKLKIGQKYYWRVDQLAFDTTVLNKGDIWRFSADSGKATTSAPRNQVSAVKVSTSTLTWSPGKFATEQTIYFGTKETWDKPVKATLSKDAHEFKLPIKLDYGKTYTWRIDSQNGSKDATTGDMWSFRTEDKLTDTDVTFYAISDLHYTGPDSHKANQDLIRIMNAFPGAAYPAEVGGNVATPRGILLTGDIANNGKPQEWEAFVADYGLNGDASLAYPIYELWGNHDGRTVDIVAQGMKKRNPSRPNLTAISKNGFHYSWDWGKVHFACANIYPGQVSKIVIPNDPIYSMDFIKEDLEKNVGKSGRPVVIEMHYGLEGGGAGWWTEDEHQAFYDVVKNYNVIAILFGHTHGGGNYKWNGIDMVNVGASLTGDSARQFVVFHVTDKELVVIRRYPEKWDKILRKPITGMDSK